MIFHFLCDANGFIQNSFPPDQQYRGYTGPRLLELSHETTEEVPTSSGFYFEYRVSTTHAGLYVAPDGSLWGAERTGTGRLGQFAAHPGSCDVDVTISYDRRIDVTIEELEDAEQALRKLAFPHISSHAE